MTVSSIAVLIYAIARRVEGAGVDEGIVVVAIVDFGEVAVAVVIGEVAAAWATGIVEGAEFIGAGIKYVRDAVAIAVLATHAAFVAGVTHAVAIRVDLIKVGNEGAVIVSVGDTIAIVVFKAAPTAEAVYTIAVLVEAVAFGIISAGEDLRVGVIAISGR